MHTIEKYSKCNCVGLCMYEHLSQASMNTISPATNYNERVQFMCEVQLVKTLNSHDHRGHIAPTALQVTHFPLQQNCTAYLCSDQCHHRSHYCQYQVTLHPHQKEVFLHKAQEREFTDGIIAVAMVVFNVHKAEAHILVIIPQFLHRKWPNVVLEKHHQCKLSNVISLKFDYSTRM